MDSVKTESIKQKLGDGLELRGVGEVQFDCVFKFILAKALLKLTGTFGCLLAAAFGNGHTILGFQLIHVL